MSLNLFTSAPRTALDDLRAERFASYVRKRGWVSTPSRRGDVAIFRKPDVFDGEIMIPLDPGLRDFEQRLMEALAVVASIEATTTADVLRRVLLPDVDLVRWRRDDSAVTAGSLPLSEGIEFYDGAKHAFMATAHTAISPALYFPRLARRDADSYVGACRMGQTEEGSFVATFFCPLDAPDDADTSLSFTRTTEPFGRRVTRLLVEQFVRVREAVAVRDAEVLKTVTGGKTVVSGNFCEALLRMASSTVRELGVSVDWSTTLPAKAAHPPPLVGDDFAIVEDLARQLKPPEEQKPETFVGKIGMLSADPEKDRRSGGDVTLHTISKEGPVRARLHLEQTEYHEATRAHDQSLYVQVKGLLVRRPGGARIADPYGFHVLAHLS